MTTTAIHLVQITDTHLLSQSDEQFLCVCPEVHFQHILQLIQQQQSQVDCILHTGDIAQHAKVETYQRYSDTMNALNIPYYHTLGNHDQPDIFPYRGHQAGKICTVDLGAWQLILLNSAVVGRIDGYISQQQLDELAQYLQQHHKPSVIAFHHHPFAMQSAWIDTHCLKNSDALLSILANASQVKICTFGHVHQNFHQQWQGIDFYATPATSIQFKPQSQQFALDNQAPAYRTFQLFADGSHQTQLHYLEQYQQVDMHSQGY